MGGGDGIMTEQRAISICESEGRSQVATSPSGYLGAFELKGTEIVFVSVGT